MAYAGQYASYYAEGFGATNGDSDYRQIGSVLADGGDTFGVSSVAFDKYEELFWMGNQGGHVTSYYGPTMQKYTSFQIHANEEVRSILTIEEGILALTKSSLKHHIRRGLPKFTYKSCNLLDMQCLISMDNHRIIMGGHQNKLVDFDLNRLREVNQRLLDSTESSCAILRRHRYMLASGDPCGKITLHDPKSLQTQHVIDTHSASLSDFDVQDNLLVSCGFSMNDTALTCDCFLLAYDIRNLRALPPLAVCCEPLLLRFIPPNPGNLAAVASHGRVQLINTSHKVQPRLNLFQVDTQNAQCLTFDASSTGQCLVFGDQAGHLHLYSLEQNSEPRFNTFSKETEFADPLPELPSVSITDENFMLSSISKPSLMPTKGLLSEWPEKYMRRGYRLPKPIDQEILKNLKMQGPIGCAPNPRTMLRNQVPYIFDQPSSPSHGKNGECSSGNNVDNDNIAFVAIPKRYRKMEVRYSKLGSNDFDFEHYNKTGFPGLEANLPNSYCNSMLQVLYYTIPIKRTLLKHTCNREFCLSCELGFLFQMLDTSSGTPCQASNFLRAFRTVPEASALGLILSNNPEARLKKMNLASLIQSWNRFILHQMHYEILETRKKELNSLDHSLSNHMDEMSLNSSFGDNNHMNHYWDEFSYNESEFPEIGKKTQKKRLDTEDVDRISLLMSEDEGKYMWLSPSALANTNEIFNPLEYDILSTQSCVDDTEESNLIDVNNEPPETNGPKEVVNDDNTNTKKYNCEETEISRLFGTKQLQVHRCLKCNREEHKESIVLLCNLQYPSQVSNEPMPFSDLLRGSLCPRRTTPAWCENCQKFSPTSQSCSVKQLPHLLAINCGLTSASDRTFWQKQMDHMVTTALGHTNLQEKFVNASSTFNSKPCRYGTHCSRPGCKFKHPEDLANKAQSPSPSSSSSSTFTLKTNNLSVSSLRTLHQFYIQNPWLPHDIVARLNSKGELSIDRTDLNTPKSKTDAPSSNSKIRLDQNGLNNIDHHPPNCDSPETKYPETSRHYSLSAVVCHVDDAQKNIVSFVKMNHNDARVPENGQPQWFLFNDFSVSPVSAAEVTWFNLEWKVPCVLFYCNKAAMSPNNCVAKESSPVWCNDSASPSRVFCDDGRVAAATTTSLTFTPLAAHEMPKSGELVGMDAEFVTLNQEEAELKSDGRLSTIRPSHLAVARITCIRGQGPLEGTPFIDDYISTQEQVVDYLTKFSGIKPGDLDANFSSKHLTTLKSTYQKLRFLVDIGVTFVGHGLRNDFRVINLVVPPEQVIDTVQLFHLPHHRMVSLKFLAWHLLGTKIQSDTHDSTEDARTALQLYRRYLELKAKGSVASSLASLYETGKALHWKVPND